MSPENWRPIPGYEGSYEVSDQGNVRSLDRIITQKNGLQRQKEGRTLRQIPNGKYGYLAVSLGRTNRKFVHRLVATAFLDLKENEEVDHINGNTADNTLSNLRCVSHSENMKFQRERKPLCKRGHRFAEVGFWNANGRRECGECRRIRDRKRRSPRLDCKTA